MSNEVIPSIQLDVLTSKDGSKLQTFPVPSPGPGEIFDNYAFIEGIDAAGYVVRLGESVTDYKGGEKIAAYTKFASRDNKYGTNAQYSVAPASTTFLIPDGISFEEAATIPLTVLTAAVGLFITLGLDEPPRPGDVPSVALDNGKAIINYSASSSTGAYATQLAKRAGYYVIGVAGSIAYAETLGADIVIAYRNKSKDELEAELIEAAKGHSTIFAYDAFGVEGSPLLLARVLSRASPEREGAIASVAPVSNEDKENLSEDITCEWIRLGVTEGINVAFASRMLRQVASYLVPSKDNPKPFRPNRVKVMPDGLASVPEGLELLRNKQVHAEKLVYRIADTPDAW